MYSNKDYVHIDKKSIYFEIHKRELIKENSIILLFLHEGLGCIEMWKDFPKLLSDKLNFPYLVYDRYGYGKSEKLAEKRTIKYLEEEAKEYLPEIIIKLGLEKNKLIIIGHSDGASIALVYNSLFGDNVIATISIAAHVVNEEISRLGIQEAKIQFESGKLKNALKKYHKDNTDTAFYGWADTWLNYESKTWSIVEYLLSITNPVLIIQGDNDQYGSEIQVNEIYNNVSGYKEKLIIQNCGHLPHFEYKDLIIEKIFNFIKVHT